LQFLLKEVANSELEMGSSPPSKYVQGVVLGEGGNALFLQRRLGGVGKLVGGVDKGNGGRGFGGDAA
jgi:hypothetical protein